MGLTPHATSCRASGTLKRSNLQCPHIGPYDVTAGVPENEANVGKNMLGKKMNLQVPAFQYFCPTSFCRVFFNSRDERCGSLLISLLPSSYQRQHCDKEIAVAAMVTLVPSLNGDHANAAVTLALQVDANTIVLAWCRCYRDRSDSERRKFLECHAADEKSGKNMEGKKIRL